MEQPFEKTEYGRDLLISPAGRESIKDLQDLPGSPFAKTDMKDLYVLAAAYGFRMGRLASADATGSRALVQRDTLGDEQVAVMEAITVAHEDTPAVLTDQKYIATVVQQYVLGGLEELIEQCKEADNPRSELISEITAAQ